MGGEEVLPHATPLADAFGFMLVLLHVVPEVPLRRFIHGIIDPHISFSAYRETVREAG